jgi:hypothetical protein
VVRVVVVASQGTALAAERGNVNWTPEIDDDAFEQEGCASVAGSEWSWEPFALAEGARVASESLDIRQQ